MAKSRPSPTARASPLTAHLGYWLRMVSNHVSHQFKLKVEAHGVTVAEWVILRELVRLGTVNPSRLADELGMTRGAISKLVERLVAKEWVDREASGSADNPRGGKRRPDRRYQSVAITPAGRKLVPVLARLADENDTECFGALPASQQAELMATLREVARLNELRAVPID